MEEKELYSALVAKLSKDFSLESSSLPVVADLSVIKEFLIGRIKELMSRDYERFLNSLYRIDVSESRVQEVLHSKDKTTVTEKLADLIIERQLLRLKTQMLYKQGKL
ncbi:MAG: hypothetical protein GYA14_16805 [Ignavibacteria bacterium]|nr:hypothetical protein [Ignavibacteria bacterium]